MLNQDTSKYVKFGMMILFIMLILNSIKKYKIEELKSDSKNYSSRIKFVDSLFKYSWSIPGVLMIYWLLFILLIETIFFFINYLLYTSACDEDGPESEKKEEIISLASILKKDLQNDIKLFGMIFIINILILVFITFLMIIAKKKEKNAENIIDNDHIKNVYNVYMFALLLSIVLLYYYFNFKE